MLSYKRYTILQVIVIFNLAILKVTGRPRWHELSEEYDFRQYCKDFDKSYDEEEWHLRRKLFEREVKDVLAHNRRQDVSWKKGINHMSDFTEEEFRKLLGYRHLRNSKAKYAKSNSFLQKSTRASLARSLTDIPKTVDWRDKIPSVVTPVKNQGACGSCWTFAAAGVIESRWAIKYPGNLQDLSEQQLASCPFGSNPKHCGGKGGCDGGTTEVAFDSVVRAGGIVSEWEYPYDSFSGKNYKCRLDVQKRKKSAKLSSYVKLAVNEYSSLILSVLDGPVAVSVDASSWRNYEEGVFDGCNQTNPDINHAVILDGYGVDEEFGKYWLIRNSWSPAFGENGYIRLKRIEVLSKKDLRCGLDEVPSEGDGCDDGPTVQTVCGTCGILFDAAYPIVD